MADYAGACHRAAPCADPLGFNPPYKSQTADVVARLHSFMQHTDDLDQAWTESAIEDHVHGIADRGLAAFIAAVPDVKTANAGGQFAAVHRRSSQRLGRDPSHRR